MSETETHDEMRVPKWWLLLPFLVAAVVYGQSVWFQFQDWDDRLYLVENPVFKLGFWDALKVILKPGAMAEEYLYIPIPYISFLIESALWGIHPVPAHLINVLLHGLNGVLAFLILQRLLKNPFAAMMGAMVFVLHPLQVESVAWAFSRKELLAGSFALISVLFSLMHAEKPSRCHYAIAWVAFVVALLCKPNVFLVFLAVPLLARVVSGAWTRRSFLELVPFVAVVCVCIAVNGSIEEGSQLSLRAQLHQLNFLPFMITEWVGRITCFMRAYPYYLRTELTGDRIVWPYLIVPAILVVAAYASIRLKAWRAVAFWILALLAIAPAGAIVLHANRYFYTADRYVYVAMLGVGGLVGILCLRVKAPPTKAMLTTSPAIVLLAVLCLLQVRVWRDSTSMNRYALLRTTDNAIALSFLATAAFEKDRLDEAAGYTFAALRADPFNLSANRLRVLIANKLSSPREPNYFHRLQIARYGWGYVAYRRADAFARAGEVKMAYMLLERAKTSGGRRGFCPDLHFMRARLAVGERRFHAALEAYEKGLELAPKRTSKWFNFAKTAMMAQEWKDAERGFREVITQSPHDLEAMLHLGTALIRQAKYAEAISQLNEVKSRNPKIPAVYAALRDAYRQTGDAEAVQAIESDAKEHGIALP